MPPRAADTPFRRRATAGAIGSLHPNMTTTEYTGTIDWDDYWRGADAAVREDTAPTSELALDPILQLLEGRFDDLGSLADVGCGPGDLAFAVAERYPEADVVGYDAAPAVLADDRERARAVEAPTPTFECAVLPALDPDRGFDVVTCLFTLCYVADVEAGLRALYDAVAPGGVLVVHYHNRMAAAHYRAIAADPHAVLDEDSAWNPETFAERFALVLEGESLLSYERIHEVLGTWPRSVFGVVDGADRYGAHRYEPLVFVPK